MPRACVMGGEMKTTLEYIIEKHGWARLSANFRMGIAKAKAAGHYVAQGDWDDLIQEAALRLRSWLRRAKVVDEAGHLGMCRRCGYLAVLDMNRREGDRPEQIEGHDIPDMVGPFELGRLEEMIEAIPDTGSLRRFAWAVATTDGSLADVCRGLGLGAKYHGYLRNQIRKAWEESRPDLVPPPNSEIEGD